MKKFAIISVYDKQGLVPFAKGLTELGFEILSTGGTAKFLTSAGIPITSIGDYTGQPEILDGRVKSLHPKIHGGILARKDFSKDLQELSHHGIAGIDLVAVNLYPFLETVAGCQVKGDPNHESLVEQIDIGGPTMIRAAAKNCRFVLPVSDPSDYPVVLEQLRAEGDVSLDKRQELAEKVFTMTSSYDGAIARYFSLREKVVSAQGKPVELAPIESVTLKQASELRYGENPHQAAGFYQQVGSSRIAWTQIQGKELSYNNLLDMYATLDLFLEIRPQDDSEHAAVIIKHSNPCGAAKRKTACDAFRMARDCDPLSAFGGIVAVSGELDEQTALAINEGFVEIVLVQKASKMAREVLSKKKNLRLVECDFDYYSDLRRQGGISYRNYFGEWLVQGVDTSLVLPSESNLVAGRVPSKQFLEDAILAWKIAKHVKSNAIVVVKDGAAIGIGAGQMSRVDSARLAVQRASYHGHDIKGSVAASDAFLPFPDTLEQLAESGISGLVQPGGSIKDQDVIAAANRLEVAMFMTGERHFRH